MTDATLKVSIADVPEVRELLLAGVRLYEALYHMPGAVDFLTKTADDGVLKAYAAMGAICRRSPLAVVKNESEESA